MKSNKNKILKFNLYFILKMCKNFFNKNADAKVVIFNLFIFFISIYITMIAKRTNDTTYPTDAVNSNIKSIFDDYNVSIRKNNTVFKIHNFLIDYNYFYILIFIITAIWIFFYSKQVTKILKRYLIICSLYSLYSAIVLISTSFYKGYKYCDYVPKYYDLWGLFRCYAYKENFLLYSLIMLYIFNRYHTSQIIRVIFIILNIINLYLALVSSQIFLSQVFQTVVTSFLFWALYDNPYYFKNSKKNDLNRDKKRRKKIELELQKNKLYDNVININDF